MNMKYIKLTYCEQIVMKAIWDAEDELSLMDILERVNNKYHKDWKSQTVSTFLARLVNKGYLKSYRSGRVFFYQILISLEEYKGQLTCEYIDFWNNGNADEFLSALMKERQLRQDEIERIRKFVEKQEC